MPTLPPEITSICFAEIAQGYSEEQAQSEAARCVNCGVCSECMECVAVCPAYLMPNRISDYAEIEKFDAALYAYNGIELLPGRAGPGFDAEIGPLKL